MYAEHIFYFFEKLGVSSQVGRCALGQESAAFWLPKVLKNKNQILRKTKSP
ncbi:MAG: hypothetical protein ACJAT4_000500 [Granulosicoccus sp.]|jgi:hypothetical protein